MLKAFFHLIRFFLIVYFGFVNKYGAYLSAKGRYSQSYNIYYVFLTNPVIGGGGKLGFWLIGYVGSTPIALFL